MRNLSRWLYLASRWTGDVQAARKDRLPRRLVRRYERRWLWRWLRRIGA